MQYTMKTSSQAIDEALQGLTAKGTETMLAIGSGQLSYFDEGIVEYSGIWGQCLTQEMGHKSSGVVNRLRDLGLLTVDVETEDDGHWWALTALGADVANTLAGNFAKSEVEEKAEEFATEHQARQDAAVTVKAGRKWTYIYAADGSLIAEVRNDQFAAVSAALQA